MSVITQVPEPNLWEAICNEFAQRRPPFNQPKDDDAESTATDYSDYDPTKHNPVFYGKMFASVPTDEDPNNEFDPSTTHPSCVGHTFTDKKATVKARPSKPSPNKIECSPTEYLNHFIFPWLLPALEAMLTQAKLEKCFEDESTIMREERRRTKFNACDFITEYLYRHNPYSTSEERPTMELWDIPFVKAWLVDHPRPPLPMSLIWTDEEAALKIQSFWRGYLVRREPDVQELRAWQREWAEENRGISHRVDQFWGDKMPDQPDQPSEGPTPSASEEKQQAQEQNQPQDSNKELIV